MFIHLSREVLIRRKEERMQIIDRRLQAVGILVGGLVVLGLYMIVTPTSSASAQGPVVYSAQFLCGQDEIGVSIAPGRYHTVITVFNSQDQTVTFTPKAAEALTATPGEAAKAGEPIQLEPGQAVQLDCVAIQEILGIIRALQTGFVILESEAELEVVAVYTGGPLEGEVGVLTVERILPQGR